MFNNDSNYLDQHFLTDEGIINKFIHICDLKKDDIVLEIGPGTGILTKLIEPNVKKITVIEKDNRLKEYLDKIDNIDIIYGDVIKEDLPKANKIITALPYSIIEPFMYKMKDTLFDELFMIIGNSFVNNTIDKEMNNLSLLTNSFFDIKKYFDIPKECFNPAPRTISSAVKLTHKQNPSKEDLFWQNMYHLNNKKCKNDILESLIKVNNLTKKEAKDILNKLNIEENILNKEFNIINNNELKKIYEKIFALFNN